MNFLHWSLGPNPPAGAHPQDIIVCFHYYDSNKVLQEYKSTVDYKGKEIVIFLLSPSPSVAL